ncbi:hypothetical protein [Bradyrhizobium sp. McL0616]|uniref:hypothetical protein n=1 Tax=Bradyrhizobium sp. McL0616 TaxID=3415674 RepID=UPI003CF36914
MSERWFRAVRNFVPVRLRLYLRAFAIFLIFAAPVVLVALYFGSDSLLMKFKRRLALVSQRNQHDAASPTSVGPGPSRV